MLKEGCKEKAEGWGEGVEEGLVKEQGVGWKIQALWPLVRTVARWFGLQKLTNHSRENVFLSGHSWPVVVVNRRLFGDESDLHFWTVASHYLQAFAQARQLSVSSAEGQTQSDATQPPPQNHLDICHDVLCESSYFQVSETREENKVLASFCHWNWDNRDKYMIQAVKI